MTGEVSVWSRDLWLARAVAQLRPVVSAAGVPVPSRVTVRSGALEPGASGRVPTGRCWPSGASPDGLVRIVISREQREPVAVLGTLVHELLHAADDCRSDHGLVFQQWAVAVGLVPNGSGTGTTPGVRLRGQLAAMARRLGPYPDASVSYILSSAGRVVA